MPLQQFAWAVQEPPAAMQPPYAHAPSWHSREQHCEPTEHALPTIRQAATHLPSKQLWLQQSSLVVHAPPMAARVQKMSGGPISIPKHMLFRHEPLQQSAAAVQAEPKP